MTQPKLWVCDVCGFRCTSRHGLYQHLSICHGIIRVKDDSKPEKTTYAGYNEEEIKEFDKTSFRNIVEFYREELLAIERGVRPRKLFSQVAFKNLHKRGILGVVNASQRGKRVILTDRVRAILGVK